MRAAQLESPNNWRAIPRVPWHVRVLGGKSANEYVSFKQRTGHKCAIKHNDVAGRAQLMDKGRWRTPSVREEYRNDFKHFEP